MVKKKGNNIEILKFYNFRTKKTLPKRYISLYPNVFAWENRYSDIINGITIMVAPKVAITMKPGDVISVDKFFTNKSLIEKAGDRFHACNDHREDIMTFWI